MALIGPNRYHDTGSEVVRAVQAFTAPLVMISPDVGLSVEAATTTGTEQRPLRAVGETWSLDRGLGVTVLGCQRGMKAAALTV